MKVAIANFGWPSSAGVDRRGSWARHTMPAKKARRSLFDQKVDWGFHIYALGVYLLDRGIAEDVEFWDYGPARASSYHTNGILRLAFLDLEDLKDYLGCHAPPDLFINHGGGGYEVLDYLAGKCFRVQVPALRHGAALQGNVGAECYLVDSEEFLDDRSMLYIPVVNTRKICPDDCEPQRDFIYLASSHVGKRHDILLNAVRGTDLTGHCHPVDPSTLDLSDTQVTTSNWNERSVLDLLRTSRIAVYPGDRTSSPAAMWECVAAGLPIVVNEKIQGGKHLVVPGVTGEFATEENFLEVMRHVLTHRSRYRPREYFVDRWDTRKILDSYLDFFTRMGCAQLTCF